MTTKTYTWKDMYDLVNGTKPAPLAHTNVYLQSTKTRTGVPNRNFRYQIRQGQNAATPFTGSTSGFRVREGYAELAYWFPTSTDPNRFVKTGVSRNSDLVTASGMAFASPGLTQADNQALTRLYKSIREAQYQISGPLFLGELRETIKMLKRPMSAITKHAQSYLKAVKKRKTARRRHEDVVADTWLEYSFGWSPFLSDVKSAAETLARFHVDIRRAVASGYGETIVPSVSGIVAFATTDGQIPYQVVSNLTNASRVRYRSGIDASLSADVGSTRRLVELSGFNMQNFIPTVWELLPWSFFIDYFSTCGNVIEAGCTDTSALKWTFKNTIVDGSISRLQTVDMPRVKTMYGNSLISVQSPGLIGYWEYFSHSVTRAAVAPGYPSLEFKLPGQPGQLANIGALILSGRRLESSLRL